MRIYIIGNDGITLCREPPATVDKGEIAVSSNEELHAARLSGKRLLALWNALPGIEKRTKVGDRETLITAMPIVNRDCSESMPNVVSASAGHGCRVSRHGDGVATPYRGGWAGPPSRIPVRDS